MLPPEQDRRQINAKTLEQQLTDKFFEMQEAREMKSSEGADIVFDEKSKSIETMLRALPETYKSLLARRAIIDEAFTTKRDQIAYEASQAQDPIQRDFIWDQKMEAAKWEYRELYEEIIMDTLQENGLVNMQRTPQLAIVPTARPAEQPSEPQEPAAQEQPVEQQPIQQQPVPSKIFNRKKSPVNEPPTI